jgi:hypothetical protein
MARTWLRAFGRQTEVDETAVAAVRSSLRLARPPADALAGFENPAADAGPLTGQALHDLSVLVPWLFAFRPVGDRARSGAPEALRRARERRADPDLLLAAGWAPVDLDRRLLDLLPEGGALALAPLRAGGHLQVHVRPALMDPAADAGLLPLLGEPARHLYRRLQFVLGDEAGALAERIARTPVPAGGWEADPAASAPGLVDEVAATLALSADAAALYLQLLAACDPTLRAIRTWNGWSGPVLERAASELAERRLAVRARRTRAGRDVFLPGPWEELKAPDLPAEAWRLRLYGGRPLGRLLPLRPLHELFEAAWRLVQAGEGPAFEEVRS